MFLLTSLSAFSTTPAWLSLCTDRDNSLDVHLSRHCSFYCDNPRWIHFQLCKFIARTTTTAYLFDNPRSVCINQICYTWTWHNETSLLHTSQSGEFIVFAIHVCSFLRTMKVLRVSLCLCSCRSRLHFNRLILELTATSQKSSPPTNLTTGSSLEHCADNRANFVAMQQHSCRGQTTVTKGEGKSLTLFFN